VTEQTPPPHPQQVPPPPPAGAPMPVAEAPAKTPSKGGGVVKRIVGVIVVLVVIAVGKWAWSNLTGAAETAKVGECLAGQSADDLKVVECTDAKAEHKVVGKAEDKTESEATGSACEAYPTAESVFWWGKEGGKGDVLCLEPVKK
jgi:hypothetical protein